MSTLRKEVRVMTNKTAKVRTDMNTQSNMINILLKITSADRGSNRNENND